MISLRKRFSARYPERSLARGVIRAATDSYVLMDPPPVKNVRGAICPFTSLRELIRSLDYPPPPSVVSTWHDIESAWTDQLNGITRDDAFWYVVTEFNFYKIPLSVGLNSDIDKETFRADKLPVWPHGGSSSMAHGFIYVPVHESKNAPDELEGYKTPTGEVWIMDTNLRLVEKIRLDTSLGGHVTVPFVSINPRRNLMYTANYEDGNIRVYKLFPPPGPTGPDGRRAVLLGVLPIRTEDGTLAILKDVQSGFVTSNNHMLLLSDWPTKWGGGLYLHDLISGRRLWRSTEAVKTEYSNIAGLITWKPIEAEAVLVDDWGRDGFVHIFHLHKGADPTDEVMIVNLDFDGPGRRALL